MLSLRDLVVRHPIMPTTAPPADATPGSLRSEVGELEWWDHWLPLLADVACGKRDLDDVLLMMTNRRASVRERRLPGGVA